MIVHPLIHCGVKLVQKLNNLQSTFSEENTFYRNKILIPTSFVDFSINMKYLHFLETLMNPVTDEKYRVALSNVSATVFPSPFITWSTITFGSIFITNFSCFFFCFFMSEDFFSTLRANTFGKRNHRIFEIFMWNTIEVLNLCNKIIKVFYYLNRCNGIFR